VSFGTNVATPLFLVYETRLDLSRWTLTALFAIYPIGLAPALTYAGPMSDVLGRKRVMVPGMLLSGVASLVMLAGADNVALLFAGRFLLGAVSGIVFVVASAWMQELGSADPMWTARLLGILLYSGFGLGPFVGGVFGQWGPGPLVTPYLIHVVLVVAGLAFVRSIPETVVATPGRRIRPNLGIPAGSGPMYWKVMVPTALGVFGLPSLTFGLFPILLRPAMASVAVFTTGLVFVIAMTAIVPAQLWVGRVGPHRAAPFGLILGTVGCGLGLVAFATDAWPILFPAAIAMGVASGIAMTSGLRLVEWITVPADRGALTGAFYAAAYAGMTSPVIVSTVARPIGYSSVLAVLTALGALGSIWLAHATRGLAASRPVSAPVSR
jgi:MFS family permease